MALTDSLGAGCHRPSFHYKMQYLRCTVKRRAVKQDLPVCDTKAKGQVPEEEFKKDASQSV